VGDAGLAGSEDDVIFGTIMGLELLDAEVDRVGLMLLRKSSSEENYSILNSSLC
jgi:hypothetical protein